MVNVFVTGGTGFIGSRVIKRLIDNGYRVTALSRKTGTDLEKLGVNIVQGSLKDLDTIASAAATADAVMHLAFGHDFTKYMEALSEDTAVVKTITKALANSGKLFVITSGTAVAGDTGKDVKGEVAPTMSGRGISECAALEGNDNGVRAVVFRLPPFVYTKDFSFFYDVMYKAAEKKGSSSYVGEGDNKLCVVHVDDAAQAYVSLLTHKTARGVYNIVGENGVTGKDMADIIAAKLHCKAESVKEEEAVELFGGFIAMVTAMNNQVDSSKAKQDLDWNPQYTSIKEGI